ncbi:MAG: DUF2948 family protein [Alphaproteobacteria bacterium]|nr:DUF2948 family protein [Alphaproteobacteria bacterium]
MGLAKMDLLKLGALDADDLRVISAHMQDSLVRVGDIKFLASAQQFALIANRFNWSSAEEKGKDYTRRRTGLHFNTVKSVRSSKIKHTADNAILELLAIEFVEEEAPSGKVRLDFAGGGVIELDVECLDAWLSDLGSEWGASRKPEHDLDAEPG